MITGIKLKKMRLKKGLTQRGLSEKSGISYPEISNIEQGKRTPKIQTIHKLAKALECNYEELIEE